MGRVDDVLKARLKTIGVSEYKFEMEAGPQTGTEWRIVDVGGSRFQVCSILLILCCPLPSRLMRTLTLYGVLCSDVSGRSMF